MLTRFCYTKGDLGQVYTSTDIGNVSKLVTNIEGNVRVRPQDTEIISRGKFCYFLLQYMLAYCITKKTCLIQACLLCIVYTRIVNICFIALRT